MTSPNNTNTQFARSITPRVAAKAADARPSLLQASAATFYHDQMYGDRRVGAHSLWGCDRHAPVRVTFVRWQDDCRVFPASNLPLGRGLRARGPFAADGRDCNPGLANYLNPAEYPFHNAVQPFKRHSKNSLRYGPEPSEAGGRKIGTFIQGQN